MSAAFGRTTGLRSTYRPNYQPTASQCERLILDSWEALCTATREGGADSHIARAIKDRLHDLGVLRWRARLDEKPVIA